MANGDIAAASGLFTPVSSGADFRQGYDDINRLADQLALLAGFGAWTLAPITPSSGFTSFRDAANNTSGTLVGGIKKIGNMLLVAFRCTNTAAYTASQGDFGADPQVCTFATGYRPSVVRYFPFASGAGGTARLGSDGVLSMVSYDSSATIAASSVISFDGVIPL